ncbi:MAG: hypothetical protein MUC97_18355 [Bernardetiaceae bacterium]|nr:hypothetical protein [Bernardetiaceae bacterium]
MPTWKAGILPVSAHRAYQATACPTGHLKSGHSSGRYFYKGTFGDNINIIFAATASNFKRVVNK